MSKKVFWKSPEMKEWYTFKVDGKPISCIEDSALCKREKKRLGGLSGISIDSATADDHMRFHTATVIPKRIVKIMAFEAARD